MMFDFTPAHELRAWLLHYSPLALKGIIHEDYFQHHLLLVESIYLLLKDVVTKNDIAQSCKLLKKYCFLFSSFYGMQRNLACSRISKHTNFYDYRCSSYVS